MGMGCTRVLERVCAATGQLSQAPARFEAALDVPLGGVLWALPSLISNGLLRHTQNFFILPKGFYGLVHVFLLLGFMALSRIKTVEQLRYNSPGELGKLLGLDRIPEVRTLREKIKLIAQPESVNLWGKTLCCEWMENDNSEAAGVLYVDGHVRTYHGAQTKLPRRYVARERLCLRGTTDYWVNDIIGRPFFVVSTPLTSGMLEMLREQIVPRLLQDVPNQASDEQLKQNPYLARFMLIFDREGYSPDFFKQMWKQRIRCQTYKKYPKENWFQSEFEQYTVTMPHGETATMMLAERGTRLSNGMWVREIRKLGKAEHQTSVISTDYISELTQIAVHMFSRWSQENFFKYMRQHYNLDGLMGYCTEPVSETAKVINPARRKLDSQVKSIAAKRGRLLKKFAEFTLQNDLSSKQMATYERKKAQYKEDIDMFESQLEKLKLQRKQNPKHIMLGQLPEDEQFSQLAPTTKQFVDTIKMIAYRAETSMVIVLRDVLTRTDDARSLLRELFTMEADLIPNPEEETLTIKLHHLTNRMSDDAIRFLAKNLNKTKTKFPGTNMRLVYKLVSD